MVENKIAGLNGLRSEQVKIVSSSLGTTCSFAWNLEMRGGGGGGGGEKPVTKLVGRVCILEYNGVVWMQAGTLHVQ